ncbi:MAG: cytochrome c [Myxococcota bacterium]
MRSSSGAWIALAAVACAAPPPAVAPASHATGPGLGTPVSADAIAARDIDADAWGAGLPPGSGSAREGKDLYASQCARCHGLAGDDGPADALVTREGGAPRLTVGNYWPYAPTLFDYLRRAMPYDRPGSLDNDALYALTAYLLAENGIVADDAVLDQETLPQVVMPGRARFPDPAPAAHPDAAAR